MITEQLTEEGKSSSLTFTTKDTFANEIMVEVFNAISELTQTGAEKVKVTVEKVV